ncbi:uncharacterized protein J7T54_002859 [Emericellopsis cladophorae]|uniref:Uncharacterized protein n=1 Tax=Emericellopsis cladophorae TaxID=2686198 RepID=A0A9P9XZ02_9HYPO|nr:uncharacterized protein J7T54_002859 [Emericellopsis cladophorae]KAI6780462.1 hypothetical protein J7T54_002859 [Emericellopsis cladophorae]
MHLAMNSSNESSAVQSVMRQSSFFRLPAEFRHEILMETFGDHAVHMDLALDRLMLGPAQRASSARAVHGNRSWDRDHQAPRMWSWELDSLVSPGGTKKVSISSTA